MTVEYDQYFTYCAPKICQYSYSERADLLYMITILLALYGGLQTALRFIVPRLVLFFMRQKYVNATVSATDPVNNQQRRRKSN